MRITARAACAALTIACLSRALPGSAAAGDRHWLILGRAHNSDGSAVYSLGTQVPGPIEGRLGMDLGTAGSPGLGIDTRIWQWGNRPVDALWYSLGIPGPLSDLDWAWDKAWVEGNVVPETDSYRIAARIREEKTLGSLVNASMQLSYALNQTGLGREAVRTLETSPSLRLDLRGTGTALLARSSMTNSDFTWHNTLQAEQRIVDGMTLIGSVSDPRLDSRNATILLQLYRRW
ncbi:hypothetical protein [Afifella sp. IM 167]|uniref:hypothetical protein n=1 Tax=Afifella sp. IM 167 TaxID=2033586 RepID=UPI001CCD573D|nr:hypothetical protein [Afifella sp. IM 167]MBZ8134914.1 hypothetical protein [Afifella sp. IM 167]